jgi:hypothetical protein
MSIWRGSPGTLTYRRADVLRQRLHFLVIGFGFIVILLVAGWRFSGTLEPNGHT